jgi:two-component system sensor histidine kinase KdpD
MTATALYGLTALDADPPHEPRQERLRGTWHRLGGLIDPRLPHSRRPRGRANRAARWRRLLLQYLGALCLVALATHLAISLNNAGIPRTATPALMLAVVISAARFGLGPSVFACALSALAFDYFFLPPLYSLAIDTRESMAALVFYTIAAVIIGKLTSRLRALAIVEHDRAAVTDALYRLRGKLATANRPLDLARVAATEIAALVPVEIQIFLLETETVASNAGDLALAKSVLPGIAATWALESGSDHLRRWVEPSVSAPAHSAMTILPLRGGHEVVGLAGFRPAAPGTRFAAEDLQLLQALLEQTGLAVERVKLAERAEQTRLLRQSERLRATLLTSISHDLRSPVAAILASADHLETDDADRIASVATIRDEAARLNRFLLNLVHMTSLEAGYLRPVSSPTDISDVVGTAFARSQRDVRHHRLDVRVDPALPLLELDPVLLEHVLVNLIENAAKFSQSGRTIHLRAYTHAGSVVIDVSDEGEGIPPAALEQVFDKFYRASVGPAGPAGTGLGLTIARGFVEAMGGRISAHNRADQQGTTMTITLPVSEADLALTAEVE